ncbi:MAG: NAD-dependent epimerase/dehydratase family protein [Candidatus Helarchaeota archaeon]
MNESILITGGAGFIGLHLANELINRKNYEVFILDNLTNQVHRNLKELTNGINYNINFVKKSVLNRKALNNLIEKVDIIFHLAALVGVGQSMYKINDYIKNNIYGTSNLFDLLVNKEHNVKKVIIASSNTIYGEGKAYCKKCGVFNPQLRTISQLKKKKWEIFCPKCKSKAIPIKTDENTPYSSSSIYALTKQVQEQISFLMYRTYGINITVLRFFLVYGPGQSLLNPYTGVCGIFSSQLFNGRPPIIFEDGLQSRDFVHVKDVVQALILVSKKSSANGEIYNVGTGEPITIKKVAETLTKKINSKLKPVITQKYRVGDIRHCIADISKITKLGYKPKIKFENGIDDYIKWIRTQKIYIKDNKNIAINELIQKGLFY